MNALRGPREVSETQQSTTTAAGLALVGAAVTMAATFAIAILVASESDQAAGKFFVFTAVVSIVGTISCVGNMTSMVYFMPVATSENQPNPWGLIRMGLSTVLPISVGLAVLLVLLSGPLADVFTETAANQQDMTRALRVVSPAIPGWAITLALLGATRGLGSQLPTVITAQIFRPLAQILLLIPVLAGGGEAAAWHLALAWGIPVLLGAVLALFFVWRLGGLAGAGPSTVTRSELWTYNRHHGASTSLNIALERFDVVLVSILLNPGAAGIYGTLSRLATAGNFLLFSVTQSVTPHLRRAIASHDLPEARKLAKRVTGWMVMVGWPYLLVLATKSEATAKLMKDSYADEGSLLIILAFGVMFSAFAGPVESTVLMSGNTRSNLASTAASFATDVILLVALVPVFGIHGAAIAWAAALVVKNATAGWLANRFVGVIGPGRPSLTAAAIAIVAVVPIGLATGSNFGSLLVVAAVAIPLMLLGILWQREVLGVDQALSRT